MLIQFSGIALFSTITAEVFSYRTEVKVADWIKREQDEVEDMLFATARIFDEEKPHLKRISNDSLPDAVFENSLMHIEDNIKYSTERAFKDIEFFEELPPRLKSRLINSVLQIPIRKMKFFFNDFINEVRAPQLFVERIMTSLYSSLFN